MLPITIVLSLLACQGERADAPFSLDPSQDDLGALATAPSGEVDGARRGAATLSASGPAYYGQTVTFTVTGAQPGESVYFVYGINGEGPGLCPGPLGGECLGIVSPVTVWATETANGSGVASAVFSYPNNGPAGGVTVSYQAAIPRGAASVVTNVVNRLVTYDNVAPVANNDSYVADEDVELVIAAVDGVLDNDTDADGDTLEATRVSGPAHGTLTLNTDGSFTYKGDRDYYGPDAFTYIADDGIFDSNTATVNITVNPVNDRPAAAPETYNSGVVEDTVFTVNAANGVLANDGPDPEGDAFTAVLVGQPDDFNGGGQVVLQPDGSFRYTPAPDYNGTTYFRYRAVDTGGAQSAVVDVKLIVGARNDPPRPVDDLYATDRDVNLLVYAPGLLANDIDVDGPGPMTASGPINGGLPQHGTVNIQASGAFLYKPELCFRGVDSFTYRATEAGGGRFASADATIEIGEFAAPDPDYCDKFPTVRPDFAWDPTPFQGYQTWRVIPENPIGVVFAFHSAGSTPTILQNQEWVELWNILYARDVALVATKSTGTGWDGEDYSTNNDDWPRVRALYLDMIAQGQISSNTPISAIGFSSGGDYVGVFGVLAEDAGYPLTSIVVGAGAPFPTPYVPGYFMAGVNDGKVPPNWVETAYDRHPHPNKVYRLKPEERVHEMVFNRHIDINQQQSYDNFQSMQVYQLIDANGDRVTQFPEAAITYYQDNTTAPRATQAGVMLKALWGMHRYSPYFKDEQADFITNNF